MAIHEDVRPDAAVAPEKPGEAPQQVGVPEPTEEIHLPKPSYLPVVLAFGVTWALVGIILAWWIVAVGGVIALIALVKWIRLTREEMAELPLDHGDSA